MNQMYPGWQYQQPMGMPVGGMYPAKSVEGLVGLVLTGGDALVNNIAVTVVKL